MLKFAFYVSGAATRLRKLLALPSSSLVADTRLVVSDSLANADLAETLQPRGITFECFGYESLSPEPKERGELLSRRLLVALERAQIDYLLCFGDHLLSGELLSRYANRIINFHPSLLPAFPGRRALDRALEANALLVGNTAHFVDHTIDGGPVIMQSAQPAATVRRDGYDVVLDVQLTMAEQIHRWLREGRVRVENGTVTVDAPARTEPIYFPPLEEPLLRPRAAGSPSEPSPSAPNPEILFDPPLHVGRPNVGRRDRLLARFGDIIDRRWFTNGGPYVKEFEERLAAYLGVRHCVAVCNATIGLEIACRALDLRGEVIVPAFTFAATAHAFKWQGVEPRFADVDPATHNLDLDSVESLITPQTSAIVGVHLWGRACQPEKLEALAGRHNLAVIYDAAHAFGCSHRGELLGRHGRCEVFSFHATKFLNSFEGGAISTNDDGLAERLRLMRNFGFSGVDRVSHLGTNGKMTEVCAAMGLTSLESIDDLIAVNRRNYEAYQEACAGLRGFSLLRYDPAERNNYQYIIAEVDPALAAIDRDKLTAQLQKSGVLARRYFTPGCHRMEPYCSRPEGIPNLGATEALSNRVLSLPTGQAVDVRTIQAIAGVLRRHLA